MAGRVTGGVMLLHVVYLMSKAQINKEGAFQVTFSHSPFVKMFAVSSTDRKSNSDIFPLQPK